MSLPHSTFITCRAQKIDPVVILLLACLLVSAPALPDEVAGEAVLPPGHGYVLIRVDVNQRERISMFAMTNVDTKDEIRIRMKSFKPAGVSAWMALVAVPNGRYFWSEYESTYGIAVVETRNLDHIYRRSAPGSADDSFEIVSGVVNYVGDWKMRVVPSRRRRLEPIIQYEKSTLERYVAQYPELVSKYQIYLSMMGKKAISLDELAKIIETQSEQSN